jgi:Glycosyltransferases involved in cell wall biogenesis
MNDVLVVITCYNEDKYIGNAIRSVLRQNRYDAISKIIVVDDGSEDNSEEVIREWEDRYEKIRCVHQKNQGLPVARNTGIQHSTGDFIALLDGDDIWLEDRLEHQLDFAAEHSDVGLLYGDVYNFGGEEEKKREYSTRYKYGDDDVLRRLYAYDAPILPSTALINRACFETVGFFDPNLRRGQDTDLWLRIASEHPVHHVGKPLALKRQRSDSLGA